MIELSPNERRELRAKAHGLHPVVTVGQQGLTPRVLHEIDVALKAHGLVKIRVNSLDRNAREAMLEKIASELDGAPVQHLGKLLIVWRPPEEAVARPAKRTIKKQTTAARTPTRAPRGKSAPNPRRRRRAP